MAQEAADCKETKDALESSIASDNSLLSESNVKLASGMEKEAAAGELARQTSAENDQYDADLRKQMKVCSQNYKDFDNELCALRKIRGDVFKKMGKAEDGGKHTGFFEDCKMGVWTPG